MQACRPHNTILYGMLLASNLLQHTPRTLVIKPDVCCVLRVLDKLGPRTGSRHLSTTRNWWRPEQIADACEVKQGASNTYLSARAMVCCFVVHEDSLELLLGSIKVFQPVPCAVTTLVPCCRMACWSIPLVNLIGAGSCPCVVRVAHGPEKAKPCWWCITPCHAQHRTVSHQHHCILSEHGSAMVSLVVLQSIVKLVFQLLLKGCDVCSRTQGRAMLRPPAFLCNQRTLLGHRIPPAPQQR